MQGTLVRWRCRRTSQEVSRLQQHSHPDWPTADPVYSDQQWLHVQTAGKSIRGGFCSFYLSSHQRYYSCFETSFYIFFVFRFSFNILSKPLSDNLNLTIGMKSLYMYHAIISVQHYVDGTLYTLAYLFAARRLNFQPSCDVKAATCKIENNFTRDLNWIIAEVLILANCQWNAPPLLVKANCLRGLTVFLTISMTV